MSPHTMPQMPPDGLANAVNRPNRMTSRISSGTAALAKSWAKRQNLAVSASESRIMRRWSAVIPDGPPAAPRRALRTFLAKRSGLRENVGPRCSKRSSASGSLGCLGGLSRSSNAFNVASEPSRRQLSQLDQSLCPVRPGLQ